MNVMLEPRIDKVVVHVGVGESGQRLVNAETILKQITHQTPVRAIAKKTLPTFGIKKKEPIGTKLTLRGKAAEDFLTLALKAAGNSLKKGQFDEQGNFLESINGLSLPASPAYMALHPSKRAGYVIVTPSLTELQSFTY